eukprot:1137079-Pelagomonas_calceolata.AAC.1
MPSLLDGRDLFFILLASDFRKPSQRKTISSHLILLLNSKSFSTTHSRHSHRGSPFPSFLFSNQDGVAKAGPDLWNIGTLHHPCNGLWTSEYSFFLFLERIVAFIRFKRVRLFPSPYFSGSHSTTASAWTRRRGQGKKFNTLCFHLDPDSARLKHSSVQHITPRHLTMPLEKNLQEDAIGLLITPRHLTMPLEKNLQEDAIELLPAHIHYCFADMQMEHALKGANQLMF